MKYINTLIVGFLLIPSITFAAMDHASLESPEVIVEKLQSSYGENICSNATNTELEMLGESVMQEMAGSDERHEWMDAMHGGEGSNELLAFHIALGEKYIGCTTSSTPFHGGMMGMTTTNNLSNNNGENFRGMHGMMQGNNWNNSKSFSPYTHHNFGLGFQFPLLAGIFHILAWLAILATSVFVARKVWDASASKKK